MKPELEKCIRQGRQADSKQPDLKERLDFYKNQYNLLGSKVRRELQFLHGDLSTNVSICILLVKCVHDLFAMVWEYW